MTSKVVPDVSYTLEGFIPERECWVPITSGIREEIEISELLSQLQIDPKCSRSQATTFRVVKVTCEVIQCMEIDR